MPPYHRTTLQPAKCRAVVARLLALLLTSTFLAGAMSQDQPQYREGFQAIVVRSDTRRVGERFTFANLSGKKPIVTFPSGHAEEYFKVFEDDSLIVLVFIAHVTGSTETFHIAKKAGHFTLTEIGALEAISLGIDFRPKVSYGRILPSP